MSEGLEQRPVGTPVRSEREPRRAGLVRGLEVGVHVRAAERVDRLLGVGDQDEGRIVTGTSEQSREDLPLHRVGVLELVDQDQREPVANPFPRSCSDDRMPQCLEETGLHVVERVQAHLPLPELDPRPHRVCERSPFLAPPGGTGGRDQREVGIVDRRPADPDGRGVVERDAVGARVACEVLVVDGLLDEVVHVLDRDSLWIVVGQDAELRQHAVAELVRRADHRRVEADQRVRDPPPRVRHLGVPGDGQPRGVVGRHVAVERLRKLSKAQPHPRAQLSRGCARERDDHELVEAHDALGDRPCGEGRDGVGLTRSGARLQHDRPAEREGPAEVEGGHRSASSNGPYVSCASRRSPPCGAAASSTAARSSKNSSHVASTS